MNLNLHLQPSTLWRANTFASKEPETLAWIDGMCREDVLWDIGANVGLYTVYAAKRVKSVLFEPSIFNLELLGRNCSVNEVEDKVVIFPIALVNKMASASCKCHPLGGEKHCQVLELILERMVAKAFDFRYKILGMSRISLSLGLAEAPSHVKLMLTGLST